MKYLFYYVIVFVSMFGCKEQQQTATDTIDLKQVDVPEHISKCDNLKCYLVTNYWERENSASSIYSTETILMEQMLAPYIVALSQMSSDEMASSLNNLFQQKYEQRKNVAERLINWSAKYMTRHESPFYNKEQYFSLINYMVRNDYVDFFSKERYNHMLSMYQKNEVGDNAPDFMFTMGEQLLKLSAIKTPYTLLVFYDKESSLMIDMAKQIATYNYLMSIKNAGDIRFLAVCVGDMDIPNLPNFWSCKNYKGEIKRDKLYATDHLPAVYLLDSKKNIILKDSTLKIVDNYFKIM